MEAILAVLRSSSSTIILTFSPAPFDHAWVDRYSVVLRDDWTFAEGWLMQAKGWFTHQDIDNRNQSFRGAPPFPTTLQNGGVQ